MAVRIEPHAEPIPGYRLLERIGSGGFGEVWKAEAPGGILKAIKIIHGDLRSRDHDLTRYAEQELKALSRVKQVRHPYLLALDRFDIVDGRLLITMELADCNLWDRFRQCRDQGLPGIPRDELLAYLAETAEVLDLFNDRYQLQHLDIKPQNLFLLHHHIKVADFGQVKDLQGLIAPVTGGITPVYAAPETFDGHITRYCDQYSLACVYQELLTGVRPFDGASMSELVMQHLSRPPNLEPSPPGDRPALARALAKRPDDRWPSVTAFVCALAGAASVTSPSGRVLIPPPREHPAADQPTRPAPGGDSPATAGTGHLPPLVVPGGETVVPGHGWETPEPVFTPAPPEITGPGPLRPALVLGLGQAGLRALQRFRFDLTERYGPPERTPAVRLLYIDTDPDDLMEATRARPSLRLAALRDDELFPARLNRAAHYLKPRSNGRSLVDGWFDPQLLYRLPRAPQTQGIRLLGRLAFCDHYRPLLGKIRADLEAVLDPAALEQTEAHTGLRLRTNRPRVYIIAGLAGGTGGGMVLDVAYAVRDCLRRLGYDPSEVVGLLLVPPADAGLCPPEVLANAYAALTELNHYSRADTVYEGSSDEGLKPIRDPGPPFGRCYLLPGEPPLPGAISATHPLPPARMTPPGISPPAGRLRTPGSGTVPKPGSRPIPTSATQRPLDPAAAPDSLRPCGRAADLVRYSLFTPLERTADAARRPAEAASPDRGSPTFTAFGLSGFDWPRGEVVARTAAAVAGRLLRRWAVPDPQVVWEVMPAVARQKWSQLGLDDDSLGAHLIAAADSAAGSPVCEQIALIIDPLLPRGWLGRGPDPTTVALALDRLTRLLGPPASSVQRPPTPVEDALTRKAADLGSAAALDIRNLVPNLADDPEFRLVGAEAFVRQLLATTDRLIEQARQAVAGLDTAAQAGFECASRYAHYQKGMRKPSAAELSDALRSYPSARFQALLGRAKLTVYQAVRDALVAQLGEVSSARERLEAATRIGDPPPLTDEPPSLSPRRLLPAGCGSLTEAVDRFLAALTAEDLAAIDRRVAAALEARSDGLLHACLNSAGGPEAVVATVHEQARVYLDARLGAVDFAAMFAARYPTPQQAQRVLEQTYHEAEPAWIGGGPWAAREVTVLSCPAGPGGDPLRELAQQAIPTEHLTIADTPDNLLIYREWPDVPLAALPQLGPAAAAAYQAAPATLQYSPHARLDVPRWHHVDDPAP